MKNDRRRRKTKQAIYKALIMLMNQKELRKITVQELCDSADIHRATFYYHYQDIFDLYEKIEDEITGEVIAIMGEAETQSYLDIYREMAVSIRSKLPVWHMLLGKNGHGHFYGRICQAVEEKYLDIWRKETGQEDFSPEFLRLAGAGVAAFVAVMVKWIYDGCPEDNMVRLLQDMDDAFDGIMEKYL